MASACHGGLCSVLGTARVGDVLLLLLPAATGPSNLGARDRQDEFCRCPLLPSCCHRCAGSSGSAVSSRSCGSPQTLCTGASCWWGAGVSAGIPTVPWVTVPQLLCQDEAGVASACSGLPFPAACSKACQPLGSHLGSAQCCGAGAVQSAGEELTPSSFPRKALASGVSLPLAAADMAGPVSRVLALRHSSAGGEGSSWAPVQTHWPPLPCSVSFSAAPAAGPAETPARLQVGRGRQNCSCRGSLAVRQLSASGSFCWLQPPTLGWLASGQVQPWH